MSENGYFVLDAVTHAFNVAEENYFDYEGAKAMATMAAGFASTAAEPEYQIPFDTWTRNWSVDELANILFRESRTDVAVYHPLPIYSFYDGLSSLDKAFEALEKYPSRFVGAYCCVDPMRGQEALDELERQVERFAPFGGPLGLKMYPASWHNGNVGYWKMNDPAIAYPVLEKAGELGIRHVAVHKSIPIEPIEFKDTFNPMDLEGPAVNFPEINFEIVHGGIAFVEETSMLLARFPNVYVNMENLNMVVARRPRVFAESMLGLMHDGGKGVMQKMFWGTGTTQYHPRPCVEAMAAFAFPEDLLDSYGLYMPIGQITREDKQGLFADNFARLRHQAVGWEGLQRLASVPIPHVSRASNTQHRSGSPGDGQTGTLARAGRRTSAGRGVIGDTAINTLLVSIQPPSAVTIGRLQRRLRVPSRAVVQLSQAEVSLTGQAPWCYPGRVTELWRESPRLARRPAPCARHQTPYAAGRRPTLASVVRRRRATVKNPSCLPGVAGRLVEIVTRATRSAAKASLLPGGAMARDLLEASIVGVHVQIPCADEMIAMAWKRANLYIGMFAHSPRYWPRQLVHYADMHGQDRLGVGLYFPVAELRRVRAEVDGLGLTPSIPQKLPRNNEIRVCRVALPIGEEA